MPVSLKKIFHIDTERVVFAGWIFLAAGLAILYIESKKPVVTSEKDLYFFSGHFQNHKFSKRPRGVYDYTFKIQEISNPLNIKADFLEFFEKDKFLLLLPNDSLRIGIAKKDTAAINISRDYVFVYFISNANNTFLDSRNSIIKHNSKRMYFFIAGLLILGLISLFFGYRKSRQGK